MGAGNPLLRSYDDDLYRPITFFIDFHDFYNSAQKLNRVREHYEINELDGFEDLTEEETLEEFSKLVEHDAESFRTDFFFNLSEEFEDLFSEPSTKYIDELSAAFRGSAIIIAENDDCLVCTTDEAETHHYPIGLIPNFKYDDILDDYWNENQEKEDWYTSRNLNYDQMCEEKAKEIYFKKLNKWRKEYQPFMKWFHSIYKNGMTVRNGAWTSLSIKKVGENYAFV